jgi:AcrR family transcriptional regulator
MSRQAGTGRRRVGQGDVSKRHRGQAAGLSADLIAVAALGLVERHGLARLSIRSLATNLGVAPSALYNHLADRDGLIDLMLELALGEVDTDIDPSLNWRQQLTILSHRLRDTLRAHPGIAAVLKGHDPTGPNSVRMGDAFARAIRRSGLTGVEAGHAWYTVVHYVIGFESTFAVDTRNLDRALDPESLAALHDRFQALDPERYPGLHDLGIHIWNPDLDERFAFGLEVVLDGITARATEPR